jgi:hypothetical protein
MLLSLVYFVVRCLLRLLTRSGERDDAAREIEILVLRHQLRVLVRGRRTPLRRRDRILLAAARTSAVERHERPQLPRENRCSEGESGFWHPSTPQRVLRRAPHILICSHEGAMLALTNPE